MVRVKMRYFLLEIVWEDFGNETVLKLPINSDDLYEAIRNAICEVLGDYGAGVIIDGFRVKMLNPYSRIGYVSCKRGSHLLLGSVLPFVTIINRKLCSLRTLHVGGTLRSCHKHLRQFYHRDLPRLLSRCKSEEERIDVQNCIRECLNEYEREDTVQL